MRKECSTLSRYFITIFLIFVTSIAFCQNSFSQSDTVEIIKEIHAAELRVREHIDNKITQHETKNDNNSKDLNDKFVDLKSTAEVNKSEIGNLKDQLKSLLNAIYTLIVLFVLYIIGQLTKPWWQKWFKFTKSTQQATDQTEKTVGKKQGFPLPASSETDYPQGTVHEQSQLPH